MTFIRYLSIFACFIALCAGGCATPLEQEQYQRLEEGLDLTAVLNSSVSRQGAVTPPAEIDQYARYYFVDVVGGRQVIVGEYHLPDPGFGRRGLHLGCPDFEMMDGGCGHITLHFDPSTGKILFAECNGLA